MTAPAAYCLFQEFPASERGEFIMDRHYLLYSKKGAMRLDYEGQSWSLPPARAALIEANVAIQITLPQRLTACSVLFDPAHFSAPASPLTVFEMTPLARELIFECRPWGADNGALSPYAHTIFTTLSNVIWRLAETPSPTSMPLGKSVLITRALALTASMLAQEQRFEDIANQLGVTPRSLARKFADELGMTWGEVLRRMRIIQAIEQLASSDAAITEIAFCVGYNSLSAFNKAFKDLVGDTPSQYRASFRGA